MADRDFSPGLVWKSKRTHVSFPLRCRAARQCFAWVVAAVTVNLLI